MTGQDLLWALQDLDAQFIQEAHKADKFLKKTAPFPRNRETVGGAAFSPKRLTFHFRHTGILAVCITGVVMLGLFTGWFDRQTYIPQPAERPQESPESQLPDSHGRSDWNASHPPALEEPKSDDPDTAASQTVYLYQTDIAVNQLDDQLIDAAPIYYDPSLYETVLWDSEDIAAYYGIQLAPAYLPSGLMPAPGNGNARVIQKKDGTLVKDTVVLGFHHAYHEDGSPMLTEEVRASKGFYLRASKIGLLKDCLYILPENPVQTTQLGDTSVTFGYRSMSYGPYDPDTHSPSGYYDLYVAEFTWKDTEFQIVTEQLPLEEIIKLVASILYGTDDIVVLS